MDVVTMVKNQNIASFVLRFTQEHCRDEQNDDPHIRWRGYIRHVQGNDEGRFTNFGDALTFIQRYLTQLTAETLSTNQDSKSSRSERVLLENIKLWEQFASNYTELMIGAMERTVKQSEVLPHQTDDVTEDSLEVWQLPAEANHEQVLALLGSLQDYIKKLTDRVENLERTIHQERSEIAERREPVCV